MTKYELWQTTENLTKQLYHAIRRGLDDRVCYYSMLLDGVDNDLKVITTTRDRIMKLMGAQND